MINKTALRQSAILFAAALIWGFTFVAQSVGMDYVGPFTFIAARNAVWPFCRFTRLCSAITPVGAAAHGGGLRQALQKAAGARRPEEES